jgi:hypothetical protein
MTARPILMSGPMVQALLDGTKTQTRRVVTAQNSVLGSGRWPADGLARAFPQTDASKLMLPGEHETLHRLYSRYELGDQLWVRETWQYADWTEDGEPWIRYRADDAVRFVAASTIPEADCDRLVDRWATLSEPANVKIDGLAADRVWRPSIFMPRWASRITLTITDIRVQRLQEISDSDCIAEGISVAPIARYEISPLEFYHDLWESINGAESWAQNPWVWALTFRVEPTTKTETTDHG